MSEQNEVKECCECCANDKPVNAGPLAPGANIHGICEDQAHAALPDWQLRFLQEYEQLKIRHFKLHKMLVKLRAGTLDFTPACPASLLREQEQVMAEYLDILEARAEIEGIPLPL